MRNLIGLVVALAFVGAAESAAPSPPTPHIGLSSSVRTSRETGDQDGLSFELRSTAGQSTLDFKVCEGECLPMPAHDLSIHGDKVSFLADDVLISPGNRREIHVR